MALPTKYHPQFFTATILDWKPLLKEDKYKDIIVNSLRFLVDKKRVKVFSFGIMPNHLICQILSGHEREEVQRDFVKYTAQKIRFDLVENNPELLKELKLLQVTANTSFGNEIL
jgi:putative transposase